MTNANDLINDALFSSSTDFLTAATLTKECPTAYNILGSEVTSITIPRHIRVIGANTFCGCHVLTNVTFEAPSKLEEIHKLAFCFCDKLQSIVFPDSVTTVKAQAFQACSKLQSVTFGKNITSLESGIFNYCGKLQSIKFSGKTLNEVSQMDGYPWNFHFNDRVTLITDDFSGHVDKKGRPIL